MQNIATKRVTSISKFKTNPAQQLREANGESFAVLTNNEASFYVVSPARFEELLEIEWEKKNRDELLTRSAERHLAQKVSLDDL